MNGRADKTPPREDDEQLVRQALAGEGRGFERLVNRHRDAVFNLCYRMLGDLDDADDCAQEVFIRIYRKLAGFRFQSAFSTWLYRVALNTCRNFAVSSQRVRARGALRLDDPSSGNGAALEIGDSSANPEARYERGERALAIERAIAGLPAKQRMLVVLRDIEGRSYEEIAELAGMKLGTVKSKLARARGALREKLEGVL